MRVNQFNPARIKVYIKDDPFMMRRFSLATLIMVAQTYGGIEVDVNHFYKYVLSNLKEWTLALAYELLEGIDDVYPTFKHFKGAVCEPGIESLSSAIVENYKMAHISDVDLKTKKFLKICEDIRSAPPGVITNDQKSQSGVGAESESLNWADVYTSYALKIPITIEDFYDMTPRQIMAVYSRLYWPAVAKFAETPNIPDRHDDSELTELDKLALREFEMAKHMHRMET